MEEEDGLDAQKMDDGCFLPTTSTGTVDIHTHCMTYYYYVSY
jgi:hypothetical protein